MPDQFTTADVERLAQLSRLALTPDETSLFTRQLSDVLAYAEQVQGVDTSGVLPTSHALAAPSALRPDAIRPSLPRDLTLSQAPDPAAGAGLFKVPRVIG